MKAKYTIEITAQCAACGTKDTRTTHTEFSNEAMQAQGPPGFKSVYGHNMKEIELCDACHGVAHLVIGDTSILIGT